MTKPFNLEIVIARVRAVARKGMARSPVLTWGTIQLDSVSGQVSCNGHLVHLTAKEYRLLELFLLNPRQVYSRCAILDHLWDLAHSSGEATVSTHVKCLRQKLKAAGTPDPIETVHGLGYRLRSQPLPLTPPAQTTPTPSASTSQQKAQVVVTQVWHQFKAKYLENIQTLAALVNTLQPGVGSPQQQESQHLAQTLAHKLVGSLGMFGLLAASQEAKHLEQLLQAPLLDADQIATAIQWTESLQQAITEAQVTPPTQGQPLPTQASVPLASNQILIVDDDPLLSDRLRIEAIAWNLAVAIAPDLTVARQMIAQAPPRIILLDLSFPGEEDGLTLLRELAQHTPAIPVVMMTAHETLQNRVTAAQLGVSAFLHKPLPAYEILKLVTDVLRRTARPPAPQRVLLVDDDLGFLHRLSDLLTPQGIQVITTADPQNFWSVLATAMPDVLILDLEMPEFDGVALCQAVRTAPQWHPLKVFFLSAHTHPDIMAKAYAAGADDYISKTLPATDIVTRILTRLGYSEPKQ